MRRTTVVLIQVLRGRLLNSNTGLSRGPRIFRGLESTSLTARAPVERPLVRRVRLHLVRGVSVFGALAQDGQSFLMPWLFSLVQRFIAMEPLIILIGVLLPMLFAAEFCANVCTESCSNVLGVGLAVAITFLKRLKRF